MFENKNSKFQFNHNFATNMFDSEQTKEKITYLLLLRLSMEDIKRNPICEKEGVEIKNGNSQHLVMGLFDPHQIYTATPLISVELTGRRKKLYNDIIRAMRKVKGYYYGENGEGLIQRPYLYTKTRKREIFSDIKEVGRNIYSLFDEDDSGLFRDWIVGLYKQSWKDKEKGKPGKSGLSNKVSIITNDFAIPWYWLKRGGDRFLCEICSMGISNISSGSSRQRHDAKETEQKEGYVILIDGCGKESKNNKLRYNDEILKSISKTIKGSGWGRKHRRIKLNTRLFNSRKKLNNFTLDTSTYKEMYDVIKITHFSGHYTNDSLQIGREKVNVDDLRKFIKDSFLIIDGCSGMDSVRGDFDAGGITSELIKRGACGCITTILPVKCDPIVNYSFWKYFYANMRDNEDIGNALYKARTELKNDLKIIDGIDKQDDKEPSELSWLFYQLIGNPSLKVSMV